MFKKIKTKITKIKINFLNRKEEKKQKRFLLLNKPSAYDDAVLSWIAPEAIKHQKRGILWKILIFILILSAVLWGFYNDAWTFSVAIIAFVIVYYVVNLEHPKDVEIKISDIGIKVGSRKYSFNRIKAFWIIYDPPYTNTLNIRVLGEMSTDITIQLGEQHPAPLREFLIGKIPELEGQSEKLSDIIFRIFKI